MTPTDIEELFAEYPDQPIRLTLSSGDQLVIPHSGAARLVFSRLVVFPNLGRGRISTDVIRYVSVVNIAMAEPLAQPGDASHHN